jgi:16S rRNA (cytosine967-C5)-methyltransferase
LLSQYSGEQPFHLYLQDEFRKNKNFGSRDRRFYRDVCYAWWRFGLPKSTLSSILLSIALYSRNQPNPSNDEWLKSNIPIFESGISTDDLLKAVGVEKPLLYTRFSDKIAIPIHTLNNWFSSLPPLWLRSFPAKENELKQFLTKSAIDFIQHESAFQLPTNSNIEYAIEKGLARVQDLGSQLTLTELLFEPEELIWDCCAGGGGKALLLAELAPTAAIFCSDSRTQILENLVERFRLARLKEPKVATISLLKQNEALLFNNSIISKPVFDTLVADLPCTGSGTWRRNPENLSLFKDSEIEKYAQFQRQIIENALPFVKKGGRIIYLTCSVFNEENTDNIAQLCDDLNLQCVSQEYVGGQDRNADYLFRAVLKK